MPNWAIAPAITTGKVGGDTVPASVCAVEPVRVVIGAGHLSEPFRFGRELPTNTQVVGHVSAPGVPASPPSPR